jgi:xylulokinase
MRRLVGRERLVAITGNDAQTGFTAPKLLWVRDHEPEVWKRVAHVLLPKDYVRLRLSGDYATDKADGSGMQLFDLAARDWSPELLELLEIHPGWLPATHEGPEITSVVSQAAAEATGLRPGTVIVAGGGDQACGGVASGAVSVGVVSVSLGTSGVVFATTDGLAIEPQGRVHAFCHAVPGKWHQMGVTLSAAGSLRWLRDALTPDLTYTDLTALAAEVPAGSDGLTFLPYLTGERTPHADPLARGAFVGLTVRHDRRHLARAVLEGVSYGLRDGLELMIASGLPRPAEIRLSGGGARSQLWCQILADTLGVRVVTVNADHAAAQGAALLASVGAGWHPSVESASAAGVVTSPAAAAGVDQARYEDGYAVFRDLYPALAPTFHRQSLG